MIKCPNCKKELTDGTRFCTACGTKLEQATPVEAAPVVEKKKKPIPTKMLAIGGGIILAAVVIIAAVMALLGAAPKDKYVTYFKDGSLYINMLDGKGSVEIASKFAGGKDVDKDSANIVYSRCYVKVSADGKFIFYPEKLECDSYSCTFDLYYRSTTKANAEGERIAKNVSAYTITEDGKSVVYLSEGTLYKHNLKEKEKIENDVSDCWVSLDGKTILYTDSDDDLYVWEKGEAERIQKSVNVMYVTSDATKVFYTDADGDFYLWNGGKEPVKIDSDVYNVAVGYNDGGAYYTKVNTTTTTMADYIIDDYAVSDAAMEKPVRPYSSDYEWPTKPDYVYRWNYDTYEEYEAAYAQYQLDYKKYQEDYNLMYARYQADIDQYYIDYDAWSAKSNRDYYRGYFSSYEYNITTVALYYFDGEKTELVADNVNYNSYNSYGYTYLSDDRTPLMTYYVTKPGESVKVNIADITSLSATNRLIKNSLEGSTAFAIASGAENNIVADGSVDNVCLGPDGKHVYYTVTSDVEGTVLYEVSTDKTVSDAKEYDTEVGYVWGTLSNGQIVYFKNYDSGDGEGTLYIAKDRIEKDVYKTIVEVKNGEAFYFWQDSNGDEGTLCYYDGKDVKEVQDDVSVFDYATTKEGGIIYFVDYSFSKEEGKLYYSVNGKEGKEIDDDVTTIITPYHHYTIWTEIDKRVF